MNKNLTIAFLVGVVITLLVVNYLPKFDIKIEMAEKSKPVKIDETQKDDSFLNETTEIVNNTISNNKKIEEKPSSELKVKEEKTNPLDKYLPNKDKYKDLENSKYSFSEPVEVEERADPFELPDRPKAIKEPNSPLIDIPQPKRPEINSDSEYIPDLSSPKFETFSPSIIGDKDALPIIKVPPPYPRRALQRCIEGWVLLQFTVSDHGLVINPRVVDADPPGIFNRSAMRTIVKWKYKPRTYGGKAAPSPDVQHMLTYQLNDKAKCLAKEDRK
jgi:periplasmic protein TonB